MGKLNVRGSDPEDETPKSGMRFGGMESFSNRLGTPPPVPNSSLDEGISQLEGVLPPDVIESLRQKARKMENLIELYGKLINKPEDKQNAEELFGAIGIMMDTARNDALTIFAAGLGALWQLREQERGTK